MAAETAKSVQELSLSGQELPEKFIYKGRDAGALDASPSLIDIPIIDIGLLTSPSSSKEELERLRSALSSWGCFQAVNHGMEAEFLEELREVTQQFFALPPEKKQKYAREEGSTEGYGNDMIVSENQTLDWTDRLYLTISPEDQRQLRFWPEEPKNFGETLHQYTMKLQMITEVILEAMARSLKLEDKCFLDKYGEQASMIARFSFYPPCPRPDLALGLKPHADGSALTFVLLDKEVEGLQFLKDNKWHRVPIVPEALLVNLGDLSEIMSNGVFKSPVHRVVTNTEKGRISGTVFCCPNADKEIEPVDGLVNEAGSRLYRKVKNYTSNYFEYYQSGRRPIEQAMVDFMSECIPKSSEIVVDGGHG